MIRLFAPANYENPLTAQGRARTIAAFHIAQGNPESLSDAAMRRDVLRTLMSQRAVGYWLNTKEWLISSGKIGKIQMLRLTDAGLLVCGNSVNGGSEVPTTPELVRERTHAMQHGGYGHIEVTLPALAGQ